MSQNTTTTAENGMGWFGWFSAAGFVILGLLYVLDMFATDLWTFSAFWTGVIALVAGVGATALYFGHDPTAGQDRETTV